MDRVTRIVLIASIVLGTACSSATESNSTGADPDPSSTETTPSTIPSTYEFTSRLDASSSSVAYDGQTMRHVLLTDLALHLEALTDAVEMGRLNGADEIAASLNFYYRFDSEIAGSQAPELVLDTPLAQGTYDEISPGKDLFGKLAGNDAVTDHVDFRESFRGWMDPAIERDGGLVQYPAGLIEAFMTTIAAEGERRANGEYSTGPAGEPLPIYVTPSGLDLRELLQKFTLGAVAFHQAADDYLDDDVAEKGLLSDHAELVEGKPYTGLEHAWDEAFGYFGAARNYGDYTDAELSASGGRAGWQGYHDTDGDGAIDLGREYNFAPAVYAAKRDAGAKVPTDFTATIFEAFVAGRALLATTEGELSEAELAQLRTYRDQALGGWEAAMAATVVHYINKTLQDMGRFGTADYSFLDHAKHWSELKGFALWFQFNPRSPMNAVQFEELHALLRDRPVLASESEAAAAEYKADLLVARSLIGQVYALEVANLGDEDGEGGW